MNALILLLTHLRPSGYRQTLKNVKGILLPTEGKEKNQISPSKLRDYV